MIKQIKIIWETIRNPIRITLLIIFAPFLWVLVAILNILAQGKKFEENFYD